MADPVKCITQSESTTGLICMYVQQSILKFVGFCEAAAAALIPFWDKEVVPNGRQRLHTERERDE